MNRLIVIVVLLVLPMAVEAKPNFWQRVMRSRVTEVVEIGVVSAMVAWDGASTIHALSRCPTCTETSALLGKHPSKPRIIWTHIGLGLGYGTLIHFSHKYERDVELDGFTLIPVGGLALGHGLAAYHNGHDSRIRGVCPSGTICRN